MAELKDLKIDKQANCLMSDVKMDTYEWDAITVKLFEDWKEKTTWIDVMDRLPRKHKPDGTLNEVLVMDENYYNHKGIGLYDLENGWAISGTNYWQPTHWIEIPELKSDGE